MKNNNIVITGGSSGIGLEIYKQLSLNNSVKSFDLDSGFDLSNEKDILSLVDYIKSNSVNYLFLNAGIASFSSFYENTDKINKIFTINTVSNINIISRLFNEIKSGLKIVVTLSTAAYINGAYEAVYNASKKAIKEYIISVNTELKDMNVDNQIIMFVPHKVSGTKMTSNVNTPSVELSTMISRLINSLDKGELQFIPKYDEIYGKVFKRYIEDPYKQGEESIAYKKKREASNE